MFLRNRKHNSCVKRVFLASQSFHTSSPVVCAQALSALVLSQASPRYSTKKVGNLNPYRRLQLHRGISNTTAAIQTVDLLERYRGLVALGEIEYDEDQVRVIMQLRRLHRELADYAPPALPAHLYAHSRSSSLDGIETGDAQLPWWKASSTSAEHDVNTTQSIMRLKSPMEELESMSTPKGIFLTGPPGAGKSFLIDLWLSTIPTPYKTRKHYSQLVLEIYRAVWEETQRRMVQAEHERSLAAGAYTTDEQEMKWTRELKDKWRAFMGSPDLLLRQNAAPSQRYHRRLRGLLPSSLSSSLSPSSAVRQPSIAQMIATRLLFAHWLLVFDEVQLLDVSSAGLLADVLTWYWRLGGVVVGSSNKLPGDLYEHGGVGRERLQAFVGALEARCVVLSMGDSVGDHRHGRTQAEGKESGSGKDWRRINARKGFDAEKEQQEETDMARRRTWFSTGREDDVFESYVGRLLEDEEAGDKNTSRHHHDLVVYGRRLHVPWSCGGIARYSFMNLCDEALGPADYLTLASTFHTLVLTDVPALKLSQKNQARRFISLIDALYEARCTLVCAAQCEMNKVFFAHSEDATGAARSDEVRRKEDGEQQRYVNEQRHAGARADGHGGGDGNGIGIDDVMHRESIAETQDVYRPNIVSYDAPRMNREPEVPKAVLALDELSIFSGKDEQFAFQRALSRLIEMTSPSYVARARQGRAWSPLAASDRKWERHVSAPVAAAAASSVFDPTASAVRSPVPPSSLSSSLPLRLLHKSELSNQTQMQRVAGNSDGSSGRSIDRHNSEDMAQDDLAVEAGMCFDGSSSNRRRHLDDDDDDGRGGAGADARDAMEEAGLADLNSVGAPRLKTEHVWGMRDDWGDRAGRWGKGVRAYNNSKQAEREEGGARE